MITINNNWPCMRSDDQDPPWSLVQLHRIAEEEHGWVRVFSTLLTVIPVDDPLGPAAITLLLDDCSLPTKVLIDSSFSFLCFPMKWNRGLSWLFWRSWSTCVYKQSYMLCVCRVVQAVCIYKFIELMGKLHSFWNSLWMKTNIICTWKFNVQLTRESYCWEQL